MIPFSPPRIDQKIIDEVVDTLKSGWITTGPKTKLFETKLTEYVGNKKTICLGSATAGLELMLRWLGVKQGDEVIVPAYTYCASANVILHCGAKPVFIDASNDFNLDVQQLESLITERTKAIIPVDIAGYPCDVDAIHAIIEKDSVVAKFKPENDIQSKLGRILVLNDAAHSIGGEYKGKKVGSHTDVSVFSFHAVKNLTTAEGGALALNLPDNFDCEEIYKYLNTISLHGQSKDALSKTKLGGWRYDVIEPGYKCNMTDIQASIGLIELERYQNDTLQVRKKQLTGYFNAFQNKTWFDAPPKDNDNFTTSNHLFLLRIKGIDEAKRDRIIDKIYQAGVSVNVHFQPLPLLTAYKNLGYKIEHYPNAFDNYQRVISLPIFYDLTPEQQQKVIDVVIESVESEL